MLYLFYCHSKLATDNGPIPASAPLENPKMTINKIDKFQHFNNF